MKTIISVHCQKKWCIITECKRQWVFSKLMVFGKKNFPFLNRSRSGMILTFLSKYNNFVMIQFVKSLENIAIIDKWHKNQNERLPTQIGIYNLCLINWFTENILNVNILINLKTELDRELWNWNFVSSKIF